MIKKNENNNRQEWVRCAPIQEKCGSKLQKGKTGKINPKCVLKIQLSNAKANPGFRWITYIQQKKKKTIKKKKNSSIFSTQSS